ncbi:Uncharacterised protein [Vibrio cholerae]|nr:Uncharacterised protein [Vibrio cholerae]
MLAQSFYRCKSVVNHQTIALHQLSSLGKKQHLNHASTLKCPDFPPDFSSNRTFSITMSF